MCRLQRADANRYRKRLSYGPKALRLSDLGGVQFCRTAVDANCQFL